MTVVVSTIAALLVVGGSWRYFRKVRRKEPDADPRLASWTIWTCATTVGALGAAADRQWPGACLTAADAACCAAILGCGCRHGNREFGRLDAACTALGAAGVGLLATSAVAPRLIPVYAAVAVSVATDLIASAPVFTNGWQGKEPWPSFAIFAVSGAVTLTVCDFTVPAGVIYPAYLAAVNAAVAVTILASPARRAARAGSAGTPVAGAPSGAGQHQSTAQGAQHPRSKALRRKQNGEQLIGDALAVVPVLGEPARAEAAKPGES